ncbi:MULTISPECIES: intradiol ring-cleavage dioxygenase [unclassified Streptomyces]|uniref:intradiol ring-cleavage dioxygenase n=1 Tax=unclassified Streptomyces TaxID=2593676 RepID=UPI002DDB91B8|nr:MULTISPECIES: intradiol ring-cleavage dioxygenase [unclassified Streptomyces]WSA95167.1 intradiol ring-cleavage dioxygenase [Streptomyces sp. NBC_01795]WSB79588.1 intradiol ring-cleavage dioxygenase [Streptomyces sp. NBC_01775]WSS12211.1 intradiol ring-cleavage dioxygenase [Streptomyces sp. NBC_01186]WSS40922.1 intradiol ring-cleavage dioxygenase [Streptomyces sp. NBC_01187]
MTDSSASENAERRSFPLGRRKLLIAGGATAVAAGLGVTARSATSASAAPAAAPGSAGAAVCSLTKEVTEGPYWLDGALVREDIREDKTGIPLELTLTVVDEANDCAPLPKALVELWHADALGEYSGFVGQNGHEEPDNGTFLRGGVLSGENGVAKLTTVYPGWYRGRCVHIHLKVHTDVELTDDGSYSGGEVIHTGQLFFAEETTEQVAATDPYPTNETERVTLDEDSIYDGGGATSGLLTLKALGSTPSDGYAGSLTVGVNSAG